VPPLASFCGRVPAHEHYVVVRGMGGTVKGRCQGCGKEIELSVDTSEVCTLCEIDNPPCRVGEATSGRRVVRGGEGLPVRVAEKES
jgi:hypothetical protein